MSRQDDWAEPRQPLPRRGLLVIVALMVLLPLPFVIPWTVDDGVHALPAGRRDAARAVIAEAMLGCVENPIQRAFTRAVRLTWLHPTWEPEDMARADPSSPVVVARLRAHHLFGLPGQHITVFSGGGSQCAAVDSAADRFLPGPLERTEPAVPSTAEGR